MWHIDRNWHVWYTPLQVAPGNPKASYFHGDYIAHTPDFRAYLARNADRHGTPLDELELWNGLAPR